MAAVNIHQAKAHFSKLLAKVEAGEEVVITRAGKPVAKLIRVEQGKKRPRAKFGFMKGQIWIAPDFDAPIPELEKLWYEGPIEPTRPPKRRKRAR